MDKVDKMPQKGNLLYRTGQRAWP